MFIREISPPSHPPAKLHYILIVHMKSRGQSVDKKSYDRPLNYWKGISNTVDGWSKQTFSYIYIFFSLFFNILSQNHRFTIK